MAVVIGVAFLFSKSRKKISWRLVGMGVGLQFILAILLIKVPFIVSGFSYVSQFFVKITDFTAQGATFVFGSQLMDPTNSSVGFIFAIQVLPILIFFSALSSGLYYLGILQYIVKGFAWVMARTMRLSGAESISAAANVFLGQTEAPLLVKPYVEGMTRSEIMCLMTGGMATIAGSVLATYVNMLVPPEVLAEGIAANIDAAKEAIASRLLIASLMNAPAAIVIAKILVPETEEGEVNTDLAVSSEKVGANLIDAIANGTSEGTRLAINVGAMLIAFIALIAMFNYFLMDVFGDMTGLNGWVVATTDGAFQGFSLEFIVGQVFRFFAWIIGIEWNDTLMVGSFLGTKTIVNEFVAYSNLAQLAPGTISTRSIVITQFALCGFANFSSIAIQIAGLGGIAPGQRTTISQLGLYAVLGGTLASFLTASMAGMLIGNP